MTRFRCGFDLALGSERIIEVRNKAPQGYDTIALANGTLKPFGIVRVRLLRLEPDWPSPRSAVFRSQGSSGDAQPTSEVEAHRFGPLDYSYEALPRRTGATAEHHFAKIREMRVRGGGRPERSSQVWGN